MKTPFRPQVLSVRQPEPSHASARQHVGRDARLTLAEVRPVCRLHVGRYVTTSEKKDLTLLTHLVVLELIGYSTDKIQSV